MHKNYLFIYLLCYSHTKYNNLSIHREKNITHLKICQKKSINIKKHKIFTCSYIQGVHYVLNMNFKDSYNSFQGPLWVL